MFHEFIVQYTHDSNLKLVRADRLKRLDILNNGIKR